MDHNHVHVTDDVFRVSTLTPPKPHNKDHRTVRKARAGRVRKKCQYMIRGLRGRPPTLYVLYFLVVKVRHTFRSFTLAYVARCLV
jgi:hypothetical protein